jgi:hypothetical protein
MDREDLLYAVEKVKRFIQEADEQTIQDILLGKALNTAMIPPNWRSWDEETLERRIVSLELRIR